MNSLAITIPILGDSMTEKKKLDDQMPENDIPTKNDEPEHDIGDIIKGANGKEIYDRGESVVAKMNREKAVFDLDLFFTELYEDYLIACDRNDIRQKPDSGILLRWDLSTTFEDFMTDALDHIDKQIESVKFAKAVKPQKISATDGDFFMSEAKIDSGSSAAGKQFGSEDYEAVYEILSKSKEAIRDCKAGKLELIMNRKSGRIRVKRVLGA